MISMIYFLLKLYCCRRVCVCGLSSLLLFCYVSIQFCNYSFSVASPCCFFLCVCVCIDCLVGFLFYLLFRAWWAAAIRLALLARSLMAGGGCAMQWNFRNSEWFITSTYTDATYGKTKPRAFAVLFSTVVIIIIIVIAITNEKRRRRKITRQHQ